MDLFRKKPQKLRTPWTDPRRDYANATLWTDLKERIKMRTLGGERLYITLTGYTETVGGVKVQKCSRMDRWTQQDVAHLRREGYTRVYNFAGCDNIAWWGVPVYIKLLNFKQFNIHATDEQGRLLYPQDTSGTLHDEMVSNAVRDFMRGLFKTALPTIDLQKMAMIGILAVGAVFGLVMMGVI